MLSTTLPILTTKLFVPTPRRDVVPRARLFRRLDEGLQAEGRLILLSAPAGFGKTSLLADWLAQDSKAHVAWLSLDEDDNDLHRFLAYLLAALEGVNVRPDIDLRDALQSPQRSPVNVLLTMLINDLAVFLRDAGADARFILVLDDYHLIDAAPIHEAVGFVLHHLPPQMRLVIATRTDPPLPLPRLRARRQLVEIRAADLRFTHEETVQFLNDVMGLHLNPEAIAALESRTEGWIASLQLAALALRGSSAAGRSEAARVTDFIAAFGGSYRHVIDYLAEEVLAQQPGEIRTFLLQTSVLERLSAPLCDAILEIGKSLDILEYLERANLFLVPLDNERRWYRYHRLFADFLRNTFSRDGGAHAVILHRRAATWYEGRAMMPDAIGHALKGQDFDHAAGLIRQIAQETLMRGESTSLLYWLRALPPNLITDDLPLSLFYTEALLVAGEVDAVEPHLQTIEVVMQDARVSPDARRDALSQMLAIRAYVDLCRGNLDRAVGLAQRAMDGLPKDSAFLRSVAGWILGLSLFFDRDMSVAQRTFGETLELSRTTGNVLISALSIYVSGYLYTVRGQLRRAKTYFEQGLRLLADTAGVSKEAASSPSLGLIYQALGEVLREMNDLEPARHLVAQAVDLLEQWGNAEILVDTYVVQARILQACGDAAGARDAMAKAMVLVREAELSPLTVRQIEAHRARLALFQGDVETALRWSERTAGDFAASAALAGNIVLFVRWMETSTLSRLYLARGDNAAALDILVPLRETVEAVGWHGVAIELRALEAAALHGQGRSADALAVLHRALSLGEPEGYIRAFVDIGEPVVALLHLALDQGILPDYARRLLEVQSPESKVESRSPSDFRPSPFDLGCVEALSVRELEVLHLIAEGYTNREIAEHLFVAVSTVKTHVNNIYGKLCVNNRVQAVTRAAECGLIEMP